MFDEYSSVPSAFYKYYRNCGSLKAQLWLSEKWSKSKQVPTQYQELWQAFDSVAPEVTEGLQPERFSQLKKQLLVW